MSTLAERVRKTNADFLREALANASDEYLDAFLSAHASAAVAEGLIRGMTPDARTVFFAEMRAAFPECFTKGEG